MKLRIVSRIEPDTKMNKAINERIKSNKVIGHFLKPFLKDTIQLKINGGMVNVTSKTDRIPIIDIVATDFKAGCLAKIKTPIPNKVVITESRTETL